MLPDDLQYSSEHVWVRLEGATASVGVTDDVVAALGTLERVELPPPGASFQCGNKVVILHGDLTDHAIPTPLSGTVAAINETLIAEPQLLAADPYGNGWLFKITVEAGEEIEHLREASEFREESAAEPVDSP